ncbi:MAG: immunoglobulin domain-containing protein, partial [Verrucomicrobiota bacterium]
MWADMHIATGVCAIAAKRLALFVTIAGGGFCVAATSAFGQNWTLTSAPTNAWSAVACSADGRRIVAVANVGGIYTSTNSGGNWNLTGAPTTNWTAVACSTNGGDIVAASVGLIWFSTNSGTNWNAGNAPSNNWTAVASSVDGKKMVAVVGGGGIWTSTNSGKNWTATSAPGANWISVASSADGTRLAAAVTGSVGAGGIINGGGIYNTTNSGATWTLTSAPGAIWNSIASSSDGSVLVAVCTVQVGDPPQIYSSQDFGATWAAAGGPGYWWRTAASANANICVAVTGASILLSRDRATTWSTMNCPNQTWYDVAVSADATLLVAIVHGGGIYTWPPFAPGISASPESQVVPVETNVTLAVSAISRVPLTYQWQFDGTNLMGATNATLSLTNVSQTESGSYAVWVTNSYGSTLSETAMLSVVPQIITAQPQPANQNVPGGLNITYSVGVVTVATLSYQWQFNGTNLIGATGASLTLTNVTQLNSGSYAVVVSNVFGATLSSNAVVTVLPSLLTTKTADPSLYAANLIASISSDSSTTVWFQWGVDTNYGHLTPAMILQGSNALSISNLITGLTPYTTYHYQAVASNVFGTVLGGDVGFITVPRFVQAGTNSDWSALVLSADGRELAATRGGIIYVSTNLGASFVPTSGTGSVFAVSSNGSTILAVSGSNLYASMDRGSTWTSNSAPVAVSDFAASPDARNLVDTDGSFNVYISTNFGTTWRQSIIPKAPTYGLAISADGSRIYGVGAAGRGGSYLYCSGDSGHTWGTAFANMYGTYLGCVACSADGLHVTAAGQVGAA